MLEFGDPNISSIAEEIKYFDVGKVGFEDISLPLLEIVIATISATSSGPSVWCHFDELMNGQARSGVASVELLGQIIHELVHLWLRKMLRE